jgi:hypothetical protein
MDTRLGTWDVRSLYRAGSLQTVASELMKCNSDLVKVQEVRWVDGGSQPEDDYTFFHRNGNANRHLGRKFFTDKGIISAVKRVELISDMMSKVTLRGHSCDTIVLSMHAPTKYKSDTKGSFNEEPKCVFHQFPKYHIKILLGDFNTKVGRGDIFKLTIENENLHEISKENGVTVVNFATPKINFSRV